MCAGYFQPEAAQFGRLSCDSLGDFYQVRLSNRFSRVRLRESFWPRRFLPGFAWRDFVSGMSGDHPTVFRTSQRSKSNLVPMQGR